MKGILGTIAGARRQLGRSCRSRSCANVHFARFVVFDEAADLEGNPTPGAAGVDDERRRPARRPSSRSRDDLRRGTRRACSVTAKTIRRAAGRTPAARLSFLRQHHTPARAFYVNRQGRTVQQILREEQLATRDQRLSRFRRLLGSVSGTVRGAIVDFRRAAGRTSVGARSYRSAVAWTWRIKELVTGSATRSLALVLLLCCCCCSRCSSSCSARTRSATSRTRRRAPAETVRATSRG